MNYFETGNLILEKINNSGFEAYFVGGYVRDYLLNKKSNDIDITTSAMPEDLVKIFSDSNIKSSRYLSTKVMLNDYAFEITTYRKDILYSDNRHPKTVPADSLEEDLLRRDFTVNAIATKDFKSFIYAPNAKEDLTNKVIRTIKDPVESFNEDALRILRSVYFKTKLGFSFEENTVRALHAEGHLVDSLSSQRIRESILKILSLPDSNKAFKDLVKTKIYKHLIGLDKGLYYLSKHNINLNDEVLFYSFCFRFYNRFLEEHYNYNRNLISTCDLIIDLSQATENGDFNTLILYNYGLKNCLYANIINQILGLNKDLREKIEKDYKALPIKKTCDLAFKGQDVMQVLKLEKVSEISVIVDDIKHEVLFLKLRNEYEEIKRYVLKKYSEGEKNDRII